MNLPADLKQFINNNLKQDINTLALKKNPFPDYEWSWILNQIQAKQKAEKKLPTWFLNEDVIFPSTLSRSEEHTSELQSRENLVCRLLLEKKKQPKSTS